MSHCDWAAITDQPLKRRHVTARGLYIQSKMRRNKPHVPSQSIDWFMACTACAFMNKCVYDKSIPGFKNSDVRNVALNCKMIPQSGLIYVLGHVFDANSRPVTKQLLLNHAFILKAQFFKTSQGLLYALLFKLTCCLNKLCYRFHLRAWARFLFKFATCHVMETY